MSIYWFKVLGAILLKVVPEVVQKGATLFKVVELPYLRQAVVEDGGKYRLHHFILDATEFHPDSTVTTGILAFRQLNRWPGNQVSVSILLTPTLNDEEIASPRFSKTYKTFSIVANYKEL